MEAEDMREKAKEIAAKLSETDSYPIHQIELILKHLGLEFAQATLEETLKIEAEGGLTIQDETRRRTPGGVFFYLAKGKMDPSLRQMIFPNYGQAVKGAVIEWENREELVRPAMATPGTLRAVKIQLIGRPGKVTKLENSVVMTMLHTQAMAPYPRGVPTPPETPTPYVVYMAEKQWERVGKLFKRQARDELIIDGTIVLDPVFECIAVFATNVTTRRLEKNLRRRIRDGEVMVNEAGEVIELKPPAETPKEKEKPARATKGGKADKAARNQIPVMPKPAPEVEIPEGMSDESADKLRQLTQAAVTLRERISAKEGRGQKATMEQKLLDTTEKQIEALRKTSVT